MAWDSSRPVPWQRLAREWVIYAVIMVVIVLAFFGTDRRAGMVIGVLISGPLYLGFGAVLAKFGYQRTTLKALRAERAATSESPSARSRTTSTTRPKPPPTRRTSTGPNRPRRSRR